MIQLKLRNSKLAVGCFSMYLLPCSIILINSGVTRSLQYKIQFKASMPSVIRRSYATVYTVI